MGHPPTKPNQPRLENLSEKSGLDYIDCKSSFILFMFGDLKMGYKLELFELRLVNFLICLLIIPDEL